MRRLVSKQNRRFASIVFLALTLVAVWAVASHTIPFRPFILRDYDAIPPQGCPGDPIRLTVHYDLVDTPYLTAGEYTIKTNWIETGSGADTPLEIYDGNFSDFTRGRDLRLESSHYRLAPPAAGSWQVYTEMVIYGRVLGWPRQQILPGRVYENIFRALPTDAGDCLK